MIMDWYYGSEINDFLVPEDQDLLDRHYPSPDCWPNWEINATGGLNPPKKFVIMDFADDSFNNQIELESSCLNDKYRSSGSSVCGGLPQQSFQQSALQDGARFGNTDDIFLDSVPEDLARVDNLNNSSNDISLENQFIAPGQLQNEIAASNSSDCLDIKGLPIEVSGSLEQCSRDEGVHEQSCFEESILNDLEMVIGQFNEKTRVCFRDALYRLARNTEQQHAAQDQEKDLNMKKAMPQMDHNETARSRVKKPMESGTNCVDRVIASLMFNKMAFNIPCLPVASSSSVISEQEVNGSQNSKAFNRAQKYHPPGDGEVPWFGPSNQQKISFGNPMKKSFMLEFG